MRGTQPLRRYWSVVAIVLIAAVTGGVLVWGGRRDEQVRARAGQVFDGFYQFDGSLRPVNATLRVPDGEVDVTTTRPVTSAPTGFDLPERLAPDGGRFVGVQVRASVAKTLPQPRADAADAAAGSGIASANATADNADPAVSVALVADGFSYRIPPPLRRSQASRPTDRLAWVAVAGNPRRIEVALTYAGVTQRVDMDTGTRTSGLAEPLYRLTTGFPSSVGRQCGAPTALSGGFRIEAGRDLECAVRTLGGLPYLPGYGWAPRGTVWFSVLLGLERFTPRFQQGDTDYRAATGSAPVPVTATAGGRAAVKAPQPLADSPLTGGQGYLAVFAQPVGASPAITFTATFRDLVRVGDEGAAPVAAGPEVRVTWTVPS